MDFVDACGIWEKAPRTRLRRTAWDPEDWITYETIEYGQADLTDEDSNATDWERWVEGMK